MFTVAVIAAYNEEKTLRRKHTLLKKQPPIIEYSFKHILD